MSGKPPLSNTAVKFQHIMLTTHDGDKLVKSGACELAGVGGAMAGRVLRKGVSLIFTGSWGKTMEKLYHGRDKGMKAG